MQLPQNCVCVRTSVQGKQLIHYAFFARLAFFFPHVSSRWFVQSVSVCLLKKVFVRERRSGRVRERKIDR